MKHKDITVLLLLYKTPKYTLDNLRNYKKFNIMILDQSNDIDLRKKIVKILPNIKYYKITSKNKGFAWGINFLSKKVKTKFFLCSQPDVKIFYNDILRLKKSFQKNKDAIISIPHIYSLNNFNLKQAKKKKIVNVERFIGAIFLSEKKKFSKIKKFDEDFFFYWEDIDLSRRIKMSNFSIYLNFKSKATHIGGNSTTQTLNNLFIKDVNFKFGEYLFKYKFNELRLIKILREIFKYPVLTIFYLITIQFSKFLKSLFYLIGMIKFFGFLLIKNIN